MQQQVVEGRDGVEQHGLHGRRQQLHKRGNASRLEYGEQSLSVHGQVVQRAHGALGRLQVVGVGDRPDQGRHHLRGVHDGVAGSLLLAELVHHHGGLGHHDLVLIVQQLDELGDGARGEVSVVLVVDQVDHGVLQHLRGLGQPLYGGGLGRVQLRGRDLEALVKGLGEHGGPDTLRPGLVELLVHFVHLFLGEGLREAQDRLNIQISSLRRGLL